MRVGALVQVAKLAGLNAETGQLFAQLEAFSRAQLDEAKWLCHAQGTVAPLGEHDERGRLLARREATASEQAAIDVVLARREELLRNVEFWAQATEHCRLVAQRLAAVEQKGTGR